MVKNWQVSWLASCFGPSHLKIDSGMKCKTSIQLMWTKLTVAGTASEFNGIPILIVAILQQTNLPQK